MEESINLHTQGSQQTLSRVNLMKTTLKYILIKLLKTSGKKKISKVSKGNKDRGLHCGKIQINIIFVISSIHLT